MSLTMLYIRGSWELVHLLQEGQLHSTLQYMHTTSHVQIQKITRPSMWNVALWQAHRLNLGNGQPS